MITKIIPTLESLEIKQIAREIKALREKVCKAGHKEDTKKIEKEKTKLETIP